MVGNWVEIHNVNREEISSRRQGGNLWRDMGGNS